MENLREKEKQGLSLSVEFTSNFEVNIADTRFTKVKIWIMHTGLNANGSYFSKEAILSAIPTLANTPILGYIEKNKRGEDDFSDHRSGFDENHHLKYMGSAYGVIPEDNNAHFEHRICDDGIEREFLVVDGLMWNKMEDGVGILLKSGSKAQSMELDPEIYDGFYDRDFVFHFTRFVFYGACILGKDVEPAMINSTVEVEFSKQFKDEITSKLNMYNKYMKENTETMEEQVIEVQEVETIETPIVEETTEVVVETTVEETVEATPETTEEVTETVVETEETVSEDSTVETTEEVVEEERTDNTVEVETQEEGVSAEVEVAGDTQVAEFTAKINELETTIESLNKQISELTEYKAKREKEDREKEETELFAKYDDELSAISEYAKIKENKDSFENVVEIEKEIALVYTRNIRNTKQQEQPSQRIYFDSVDNTNNRYGSLVDKYKF